VLLCLETSSRLAVRFRNGSITLKRANAVSFGSKIFCLSINIRELADLGVAFVSVTEAFDMSTSTGKAMAGMLSVFSEFERDILRKRVKAGIAQARSKGRPHGRPRTAARQEDKVKRLYAEELTKTAIADQLKIGRTSVIRILSATKELPNNSPSFAKQFAKRSAK
jgi:DNA invertase Pin-like site-specific DNA recombinase